MYVYTSIYIHTNIHTNTHYNKSIISLYNLIVSFREPFCTSHSSYSSLIHSIVSTLRKQFPETWPVPGF